MGGTHMGCIYVDKLIPGRTQILSLTVGESWKETAGVYPPAPSGFYEDPSQVPRAG